MIEAKDFRKFIRIYSQFKSERLSTNIELTLHKALIRSIMVYVCTAWEFAADKLRAGKELVWFYEVWK
jgi:hypothetical protein